MRNVTIRDGTAWLALARANRLAISEAMLEVFPLAGHGFSVGRDGVTFVVVDERGADVRFLEAVAALEAAHVRIDEAEDAFCEGLRRSWVSADTLRARWRRAVSDVRVSRGRAGAVASRAYRDMREIVRDRFERGSLRPAKGPRPEDGPVAWLSVRQRLVDDLEAAATVVVVWMREARLAAKASGIDPSREPWDCMARMSDDWRAAMYRAPMSRTVESSHGIEVARLVWSRDGDSSEPSLLWPGLLGAALAREVDDVVAAATALQASDIVVNGDVVALVAGRDLVTLPLNEAGMGSVDRLMCAMGSRETWHVLPDSLPGLEATAGLRGSRVDGGHGPRYSFRLLSKQGVNGFSGQAMRRRARDRADTAA